MTPAPVGRVPGGGSAVIVLTVALCTGCASVTPKVEVRQPTTTLPVPGAPPVEATVARPGNGAIFHAPTYRGLFEDRRARLVGDVITVQIQERHSARRSSNSSLDRTGKVEAKVGLIPFVRPNERRLDRLQAQGNSTNTFEGKGATATDNQFTGTITVTVIEVLPNGNLVVSGEKQVGINQNVETLRFSGVVNPTTVLPGNLVSSTQIADARLEVRGTGDIDRAQTTGWLSRFFLSFLPI